jgi:hypothetical protein
MFIILALLLVAHPEMDTLSSWNICAMFQKKFNGGRMSVFGCAEKSTTKFGRIDVTAAMEKILLLVLLDWLFVTLPKAVTL